MPIRLACPCGKKVVVRDEHAGKSTRCPGCGRVLRIPLPGRPPVALPNLPAWAQQHRCVVCGGSFSVAEGDLSDGEFVCEACLRSGAGFKLRNVALVLGAVAFAAALVAAAVYVARLGDEERRRSRKRRAAAEESEADSEPSGKEAPSGTPFGSASGRMGPSLDTPIGTLESAYFTSDWGMWLIDQNGAIPGMKVREYLAVRFRTKARKVGPWNAADFKVADERGNVYGALAIDVGARGLYWYDHAKEVIGFDEVTLAQGAKPIAVVAFDLRDPTAKRVTVRYKKEEARLDVLPSPPPK